MLHKIKIPTMLVTFSLLAITLLAFSLLPKLQVSLVSQIPHPPKLQVLEKQPAANVVVDYTNPMGKLDPLAIGMDLSGYGSPNVFVNDQVEQQKLKALGIKYMRIDLKYSVPGDPTSKIVCGALGADPQWTGSQWIQAIKSIGAVPLVILPDNTSDAANIVKYFNKDTNNSIQNWIIANEPDQAGIPATTYSTDFNRDYDAMKAIDPSIKIGGGATASDNTPFLQTFLQLSGSRVDFIDFHEYAQEGTTPGDYNALLQTAAGYENNINDLRSLIQQTVPDRAAQIGIEVGEWELNWGGEAQDNENFHAVWAASALGHILNAHGRSLFYADKGNAIYDSPRTITDFLGRVVKVNVDDTNPAYHGIGMFTGEGLFQGFGDTLIHTTTILPNIEVYASDNPKNIVVINKDSSATQTAIVNLPGITSGSIDVWRKDESTLFPDPPLKLETLSLQNGTFTYQLPPFSITTFVLHNSPTISPTPS